MATENSASFVDIGAGILANSTVLIHGQYLKQTVGLDKISLYDEDDIYAAIRKSQEMPSKDPSQLSTRFKQPPIFSNFWASINTPFVSLTLEDFRLEFQELSYNQKHYGVDDTIDEAVGDIFLQSHCDLGEQAIACNSLRSIRDFAKRGIPSHLRPAVWDFLLQSEWSDDFKIDKSKQKGFHLKAQVMRYDLLIDRVILSDSRQCQDDDSFFVFEDIIRDVMILWSRDNWIQRRLSDSNQFLGNYSVPMEESIIKGQWSIPIESYPPNGVLPFWGISSYAMIVSFLHSDVESAYMTFRELYVRYFYHLHTISLHPGGIVSLCAHFESFLRQLDACLFLKLNFEFNCQPLKIAFRWMLYGFIGILDIEQVLLLWDRIIGYDKLQILPAVAASIFIFRREALMSAKTERDVETAFADLQAIRVIPLLQHFIFLCHTDRDMLPRDLSHALDFDEADGE
ncbi:hypothetical protein HDU67_006987 [Dinochytrium kinnereticum]|nr:hypothetical protein HDU67_006987 [Dinochytrium kinnereticum]